VSVIRILVVDDFPAWRRFIRAKLQPHQEFQIVGEASDGVEALQKIKDLRPELILLDIGLPKLNGFEVAKQVRQHCTETKILFVSENRSREIVEEALRLGSGAYVVKTDADNDLMLAVKAVLKREHFVSMSLTRRTG
jgi:DNA-binding NarL/FixJ family response regulator